MAPQCRRSVNRYETEGAIARIFLRRKDGTERVCIIDADLAPTLLEWTWDDHGTAVSGTRFKGDRRVLMHRVITGARRADVVDHINGDGFDNRRARWLVGIVKAALAITAPPDPPRNDRSPQT